MTIKQYVFYIANSNLNDNVIFLDYGDNSIGKLFCKLEDPSSVPRTHLRKRRCGGTCL